MKNLLPSFIVFALVFALVLSCSKTHENFDLIDDPVVVYDTIYLHDTIQNFDTLFIFHTIIHSDTIVTVDTIISQDTSAFSYLFRHYELETYDVLFYTIDKQKSPRKICKMKSDAHYIDIIAEGNMIYPVWSPEEDYIFYVDIDHLAIAKRNLITDEVEHIYQIDRNIMFLRYFPVRDMFLVSYQEEGLHKIGAIDYHLNTFIELTAAGADEYNPTTSETDDWIYYSKMNNGTADIYRRKLDNPSLEEEVYIDPEFNLASFSVSADGKFLITPKYFNGKGFVVFYDINRQENIHELELPVEGHPLYATLSKDNKAIFFVNGTPYNYSEPRQLYRMGLDRTQLLKMTSFTDQLAIRPLVK